MVLFTLILGCLERTGEEIKLLDPRFTELPSGVGAKADGGGWQNPFEDFEGDMVRISGEVVSEFSGAIDLDFRAPDAAAEGGRAALGKVALQEPGTWNLNVPLDFGHLVIESFQDMTDDGPTLDDPYGWIEIEVGEEAINELVIALEVGGLEAARQNLGQPMDPFAEYEGEMVTLIGVFESELDAMIQIDMRHGENLENLAKWLATEVGPWSVSLPKNLGPVEIQAFQDLTEDGPSDDDPFGFTEVVVGDMGGEFGGLPLVVGGKLLLAELKGHSEDEGGEEGEASVEDPFGDHEGPWTQIEAQISSEVGGTVVVDIRVVDVSEPGGNRRLAGLSLEGPGIRTFRVPRGLGELILEIYQDPDSDGPSDLDPWAQVTLDAQSVANLSFEAVLVGGTRGQPAGDGGGTGGSASLISAGESGLSVSGTISLEAGYALEGLLDLDVFTLDSDSPGGRRYLGKLKVKPGDFSFQVPMKLERIEMEVFYDRAGDGPTPGDAFGSCPCNPLKLDGKDVTGLVIEVSTKK